MAVSSRSCRLIPTFLVVWYTILKSSVEIARFDRDYLNEMLARTICWTRYTSEKTLAQTSANWIEQTSGIILIYFAASARQLGTYRSTLIRFCVWSVSRVWRWLAGFVNVCEVCWKFRKARVGVAKSSVFYAGGYSRQSKFGARALWKMSISIWPIGNFSDELFPRKVAR